MKLTLQEMTRALADETRLRAVILLQRESELCVCELSQALDIIQPMVSRHLGILRQQGILLARREGQWVYYRINSQLPAWAGQVIGALAQGAARKQPFSEDRKRLRASSTRKGSACAA